MKEYVRAHTVAKIVDNLIGKTFGNKQNAQALAVRKFCPIPKETPISSWKSHIYLPRTHQNLSQLERVMTKMQMTRAQIFFFFFLVV